MSEDTPKQDTPEQVNAQAPATGSVDSTPSGQPAQTPAEQTPTSDEIRDPAAFYKSRYEAADRVARKANERITELEAQIAKLSQAQQDALKSQIESVRKEVEDEKAAAKAEAREWQVKALLAARGLPESLAKRVQGEDEESIGKDIDELAELFKAAPRTGQPQTRLGNGGSGPSLTIDEIKRMTPQQVAERWDDVQAVIRTQK